MIYTNGEMKISELVGYLRDGQINLSPVFQRGHVWPVTTRRRLVRNIVQGKPIPAIFLYKQEAGSMYSYNILDGKQRIESLILFIGAQRSDFAIPNWAEFFSRPANRHDVHFYVEVPKRQTFKNLSDVVVRDFREYKIPIIEISLDDEGSSLDEMISLFVDINLRGAKVKRFDIVKAMGQGDPLLKSVFDLIALAQERKKDSFYKAKDNVFTRALKRLQVVANLEGNSKVDRMWERLLEFALFARNKQHRKSSEVLQSFISVDKTKNKKLDKSEIAALRRAFTLVTSSAALAGTRLATDHTHFYTMVTAIMSGALDGIDDTDLLKRLVRFGQVLDGKGVMPGDQTVMKAIKGYRELSDKRTTDAARRLERQNLFAVALRGL